MLRVFCTNGGNFVYDFSLETKLVDVLQQETISSRSQKIYRSVQPHKPNPKFYTV